MVTADADTMSAKVQGFDIGMRVHRRTPFSRIDFEQDGQAPFPFLFSMIMDPMDDNRTYFHIELRAELNTMMKMFIGSRLHDLVDKLTDGIAKLQAVRCRRDSPLSMFPVDFIHSLPKHISRGTRPSSHLRSFQASLHSQSVQIPQK